MSASVHPASHAASSAPPHSAAASSPSASAAQRSRQPSSASSRTHSQHGPQTSAMPPQPRPPQSDQVIGSYRMEKTIGQGTYGKVKLASNIQTGEKVAIKVIEKCNIQNEKQVARIQREIRFLKLLHHPHIVKVYDVLETADAIYIVMEYAVGGELFDYIVAHKRLKEKEARSFFRQVLSAVDYCHKNSVIHRDLKPENLLLDENKQIKIIDFGFGNTFKSEELLDTFCGSPFYAAPEMILGKRYEGPEVDIWSLGVILFALLCGHLPFDDENIKELYRKISSGSYNTPDYLSKESRHLIARMITVDPKRRATLEEVRNHVWVNDEYDAPPDNYLPERPPTDSGNINKDIFQRLMAFGYSKEEALRALVDPKQNPIKNTYYLLSEMLTREERKLKDEHERRMKEEQEKRKLLEKKDETPSGGKSPSDVAPIASSSTLTSVVSGPLPAVVTANHAPPSSLSAPPSAMPNASATSPSRGSAPNSQAPVAQTGSLFSINEDHTSSTAESSSISSSDGGSKRSSGSGSHASEIPGPSARLSPQNKGQFVSMPDTFLRDRRQSTPEYRGASPSKQEVSNGGTLQQIPQSPTAHVPPHSATAAIPPMQLPHPAVSIQVQAARVLEAQQQLSSTATSSNGSSSSSITPSSSSSVTGGSQSAQPRQSSTFSVSKRIILGQGGASNGGGHVASLTIGAPGTAGSRSGSGAVAGPAAIAALKSEDLEAHRRRLSLPALDGSQPNSPTTPTNVDGGGPANTSGGISGGTQRRRQSSGGRNRHELRSVSGWFLNVSTTSSKLPSEILDELRRVLTQNQIQFEHDGGYLVMCKDPAYKSPVEFEVEICKVPRLSLFGLHFKRINGSIWNYKKVCNKILQEMSL